MNEGDAFAFSTEAGNVIDEFDAGRTAALQRGIEVIDGETDMMKTGTALGDEFADRRRGVARLQQLDERFAGTHGADVCAVGVVDGGGGRAGQVAITRKT